MIIYDHHGPHTQCRSKDASGVALGTYFGVTLLFARPPVPRPLHDPTPLGACGLVLVAGGGAVKRRLHRKTYLGQRKTRPSTGIGCGRERSERGGGKEGRGLQNALGGANARARDPAHSTIVGKKIGPFGPMSVGGKCMSDLKVTVR